MNRSSKLLIILLRVVMGWYFLYQGITSILNSSWTLLPFIKDPGTFPVFYNTLAQPSLLPYASYAAKGLFVIIGAMLILGIFVRITALVGALLMLFFYFPLLHFPHIEGGYIVDQYFIYALVCLFLCMARAGEYFGMGSMFKFSRY